MVKMTYVIFEHCLISYIIYQWILQSKIILFLSKCLSCISVDATHFEWKCSHKKIVDGWAQLLSFSIRPILKGEELRHNYGESDLTWQKNVNILYLLYLVNYLGHHKDHLKICSLFWISICGNIVIISFKKRWSQQ